MALLKGDIAKVLAILEQGLSCQEHLIFVQGITLN
jgi:hypothetical protein